MAGINPPKKKKPSLNGSRKKLEERQREIERQRKQLEDNAKRRKKQPKTKPNGLKKGQSIA